VENDLSPNPLALWRGGVRITDHTQEEQSVRQTTGAWCSAAADPGPSARSHKNGLHTGVAS